MKYELGISVYPDLRPLEEIEPILSWQVVIVCLKFFPVCFL